jgi:DNA transformation protein
MKRDNRYLDFVIEQLAPLGSITSRAMFGGYCLYADGVVFALLADGVLFLKTDELNRGMFVEAGLQPFRPFEDKTTVMSYYRAPAELFESGDGVQEWAAPALAAGKRAQHNNASRLL